MPPARPDHLVHPLAGGLDERAWQLLAIFASTIVGVVTKPLPMGAVAFVGLTVTVINGTLTPAEAMSRFSDSTVWLIVTAFFIACGLVKTGAESSDRVPVHRSARAQTTLDLSFGLVAADLVLAPAIPSNTARSVGAVSLAAATAEMESLTSVQLPIPACCMQSNLHSEGQPSGRFEFCGI